MAVKHEGWVACEHCGVLVSADAQHRLGWALCDSCHDDQPSAPPPIPDTPAQVAMARASAAIEAHAWTRAQTALADALRWTPFDPRAMRMLALINSSRGLHAVAWSIWEKAHRLAPDAEGLLYLGYYFWRTGNADRAAYYWREAASLAPNLPAQLARHRSGCAAFTAFPAAREACLAVVTPTPPRSARR